MRRALVEGRVGDADDVNFAALSAFAGVGLSETADPLIFQDRMLCTDCQSGYHAPYERFERLASKPEVSSFLMRCKQCAALWNESSAAPELLTLTHARGSYPLARI